MLSLLSSGMYCMQKNTNIKLAILRGVIYDNNGFIYYLPNVNLAYLLTSKTSKYWTGRDAKKQKSVTFPSNGRPKPFSMKMVNRTRTIE